ncbi:MAG: SRPBCC family protein [Stenotrophobium sp.]
MNKTPDTVYVTYIAATPQQVWEALTQGEITKQYFFGRRIESEWKVGGRVVYWQPDGKLDVSGEILECDPPSKLRFTWRVEWVEEMKALPPCIVTYQIDDLGEAVRLTVIEEHPAAIEEKWLEGGRRGWPIILCSLKSWLETGKPLPDLIEHGKPDALKAVS